MASARIYNLFPLLVRPVGKWEEHLPRIADLRFNWVFLNPFQLPGGSGSLYAVKDYYRLNPLLQGESHEPPEELLRRFLARANRHGVQVMMDLVLNHTAKWWDFHGDWLLKQYEQFRHIAPSIAFPESHDTKRLAEEKGGDERQSRLWYLYAAFFSAGVMMPIGYEYSFRKQLHVVETRPKDWEEPAFDLSSFIAAANEMKERTPVLNEEGPQERITPSKDSLVGLLRRSDHSGARAVALINTETDNERDFAVAYLRSVLEGNAETIREVTPSAAGNWADGDKVSLPPLAVRIFHRVGSIA